MISYFRFLSWWWLFNCWRWIAVFGYAWGFFQIYHWTFLLHKTSRNL